MTREVAHFQMFEAALESIPANFPPGILQSDPRHSNSYFNLSNDDEYRGPWNEGQSPQFQEEWKYIDDPIQHVHDTMGLLDEIAEGTSRTEKAIQKINKSLSAERKSEVDEASGPDDRILSWSTYLDEPVPGRKKEK
jgi:Mn-containing catalase